MGGKESKSLSISYEDAVKRVTESELRRLKEAFKRTSINGVINCSVFTQDVLGDCVPTQIAEYIYTACGGTQRGIGFKELLCGLVLLTRGKQEERLHFLYNLYSTGSGSQFVKDKLAGDQNYGKIPSDASYEDWRQWQLQNLEVTPLSCWLLTTTGAVSLGNDLETPTFFQSLAGVTHLEEADIIELEKHYWMLKSQSGTGRLDLETLVPMISPPMPLSVCPGLVAAFDENRDNHIDFKEMACGISAACRGPLVERMKFCFKIFDGDRDGMLSELELKHMIEVLSLVRDDEIEAKEAKEEGEDLPQCPLSMEEWLVWTSERELPLAFLRLLDQLCHVVLGLRPVNRHEEGDIVMGWMSREERRGLKVGQFWYLVASSWWNQWYCYCLLDPSLIETNVNGNEAVVLGPIDNTILVESARYRVPALTGEGGRLKRNLVLTQGRDFHLLPDALWKALVQWHGGSPALPRQVILPATGSHVELELYPLVLRLLMHRSTGSSQQQQQSLSLPLNGVGSWLPMSSSTSCYKRQLTYIAAFSRMATVGQVYQFLCNRLRLRNEDVRLWHVRESEVTGTGMTLLEDEQITLEELGLQDDSQLLIEVRNKDQTWPEELGRLREARRDEVSKGAGERGATGLNNLGNTCFMNAALQCASNTGPLTRYFITGAYLRELNPTNPLGTRGHMAVRYAELLRDIWSGSARSVAPLKLRWTIAKYAPRFGGFQQHDSQELLAFLLDGLHEDLNRVRDAPYVELADSEGRDDAQVAQEAWENHLLRSQSIIVDLFHGQLKSTVRCEQCQWESVRFDPFTYLTLPLPIAGLTRRESLVSRLDGSIPVRYGILLAADVDYATFKTELSKLCEVPAAQLLLAEVALNNIECFPADESIVQEPKSGTRLYAYEMPSVHSFSLSHNRRSALAVSEERRSFKAIQRSESPITASLQSVEEKECNNDNYDSSSDNSLVNGWGYLIAVHRKMMRQDIYFVSSQKTRPSLFGVPVIVPCGEGTTHQELYRSVWRQVARLVTPLPPTETAASSNHAQDCDDSLGYEFPFVLRAVDRDGKVCAWCPWHKFCRGCRIRCDGEAMLLDPLGTGRLATHLAIDWDPTALHLRYQTATELACEEHESVLRARNIENAPLPLSSCLEAFTKEERLERYHCPRCAESRTATKRLQLWRLPPVLVIHLKRFQCVRGKWVKSQKAVRFPIKDFNPSTYLADPQHHHRLNYHKLQPSINSEDLTYHLYAVVCHSGIMGGGHYVSYARNPDGGQWYYYNDSSCRESNPETVLNETATAYILFYQRDGISEESYLPPIPFGQNGTLSSANFELTEPDESELRRMCVLA